jgi:hypothetical protein
VSRTEPLYEVTGTICGKRIKERVHTPEQARSSLLVLFTGNVWYLSVLGRKRLVTSRQARREAEGGAA